jgi:hypothetical protein
LRDGGESDSGKQDALFGAGKGHGFLSGRC